MKRVLALLALVGAVAFGPPAWAEEKVAAAEAATAQVASAAPAAAAEAAAPAAAPALVPNKGDTAWVMVCASLVILMSIPGLALFYGGLVRTKNMLSVLMQVFVIFSLITVLWVVYGWVIFLSVNPPITRMATFAGRGGNARSGEGAASGASGGHCSK